MLLLLETQFPLSGLAGWGVLDELRQHFDSNTWLFSFLSSRLKGKTQFKSWPWLRSYIQHIDIERSPCSVHDEKAMALN